MLLLATTTTATALSLDDWSRTVLIATTLISLAKPILEDHIPAFRPGGRDHDGLLMLLNFLLCLTCVLWESAIRGQLSFGASYDYLAYTVEHWAGSQTLYHVTTGLGRSIGDSGIKATFTSRFGPPTAPTAQPIASVNDETLPPAVA